MPTVATSLPSSAAAPGAAFPCAWTRSAWASHRLHDADIVMMGGGSDRDQLAVAHEFAFAQKTRLRPMLRMAAHCLPSVAAISCSAVRTIWARTASRVWGVIAAETVRGSDRLIGNVAVKADLAPGRW